MWCFLCQKDFTTQSAPEEAACVICENPVVERIDTESHVEELKTQEVISRSGSASSLNQSFKVTEPGVE